MNLCPRAFDCRLRDPSAPAPFDSNAITPGTRFMSELAAELQALLEEAVRSNPHYHTIQVGSVVFVYLLRSCCGSLGVL